MFINMKNEIYKGFDNFQNAVFIFSKIKIWFIKAVRSAIYFLAGSKFVIKFSPKAAFDVVEPTNPAA